MFRIESLLSARLFASPQRVGDRLYFLSNLAGHISLYAMDYGGSVPEPLLPPHIALQNPVLTDGLSFYAFPRLGKILVMLESQAKRFCKAYVLRLRGKAQREQDDGANERQDISHFHCFQLCELVNVDLGHNCLTLSVGYCFQIFTSQVEK